MLLQELPLELIIKICNLLEFNDIRNLFFISKNLAIILQNTVPLLVNQEFTQNFIAKIINSNNLANKYLARQLITNIHKKKTSISNLWYKMLKLRFLPLFQNQNKFRYSVDLIPNQFISAKLNIHPERKILREPEIYISGEYKIEDKHKSAITIDINYHNYLFNQTLKENKIVFTIRTSISISQRVFYAHSDFYINDKRVSLNNYRGYLYLGNKEFNTKFKYNINKREGELIIKMNNLKYFSNRDNKIKFCCYIMSKLLSIPIDNKKVSGNLLTDVINKYMGCEKNNIQNLLFGNLRELYIPSGNYISL